MSYSVRVGQGRDYPVSGAVRVRRDELSRNGADVNPVPVQPVTPRVGDPIRIGDSVLAVTPGARAAPAPPAATVIQAAPPAAAKPPGRGRGCWLWLLGGCLVLVVGCVVLAGGGFVAYQQHWLTLNTVLNLVGQGPGAVEVDNFRDDTLRVSITQVEVSSKATPITDAFEVNTLDIHTSGLQNPGRFRLDFGTSSGGADLGACTITLKGGDRYQFVALPDKVVVNRSNRPANSGPDFVVSTSALCR